MNAPVSNALIDLLRQTRVVAALREFMRPEQVNQGVGDGSVHFPPLTLQTLFPDS